VVNELLSPTTAVNVIIPRVHKGESGVVNVTAVFGRCGLTGRYGWAILSRNLTVHRTRPYTKKRAQNSTLTSPLVRKYEINCSD